MDRRCIVITLSDSSYAGRREDASGPLACRLAAQAGYVVGEPMLLPDDRARLADTLRRLCDEDAAELILTTGGTGFAPSDQTPEATRDVIEREAPGIAEAMRLHSMQFTPRAMLSRAVAGIRGRTLIVNLPGSPRAVEQCLTYILPALGHGLDILRSRTGDCARP